MEGGVTAPDEQHEQAWGDDIPQRTHGEYRFLGRWGHEAKRSTPMQQLDQGGWLTRPPHPQGRASACRAACGPKFVSALTNQDTAPGPSRLVQAALMRGRFREPPLRACDWDRMGREIRRSVICRDASPKAGHHLAQVHGSIRDGRRDTEDALNEFLRVSRLAFGLLIFSDDSLAADMVGAPGFGQDKTPGGPTRRWHRHRRHSALARHA